MNMRGRAHPATGNPFVQLASLLVLILMLVGAVFVGAVILSLLLGVGAILALIISVRSWWLRRRLRDGGFRPGPSVRDAGQGQVIDVRSYTVVEERAESRTHGRKHGTTHDS